MDKECLLKISEEINCEYELGITYEINDFLDCQENVGEYQLNYEENWFKLIIKLNKFDLEEVKQVFYALTCFIDYNSTFYIREDLDERIEYLLVSSMKSKKGYRCKISFSSC